MMNDGTNLHCANLAFRTLSRMGEPAIPAFQAAFADTNAPYRRDAFFHACAMDHKLGRTNATVPILTAALHDQDPVVRDTAEVWLRQFQEDGLIKAKAE
jgi:hypothetical protein